ncbi:MAG: tetratricopeptide repeat protein [Burkholderiales bacterium]|jgi:predicted O-linked N-acetylglucosamine transferase (SPINDLY family)|nr:tetratricopeptide repeat protein [Burkholderiales bacterium]
MSTLRRLIGAFGKSRDGAATRAAAAPAARAADEDGLDDAARLLRDAIEADPDNAALRVNYGTALKRLGAVDEAEAQYRRATELAPTLGPAWFNLGLIWHETWRLAGAEDALWKALQLAGGSSDREYLSGLVRTQMLTLQRLCEHAKARAFLAEAKQHFPILEAECDAIGLFALNADPEVPGGERFRLHREWAARYADPLTPAEPPRPGLAEGERLRIGYVSGDFREHAVASFIEPILERHDTARFAVHCYDNSPSSDHVTARLRALPATWRAIAGLDDAAAAELIRRDRIHVLVDLSGHTAHNCLLAFARKPAPVQMTYLGYLATTGMKAMDFRITDGVADPEGVADPFYTERLLRLPGTQWCYRPPADAPEPGPAGFRGGVTFGSLNQFLKVTPEMAALWARIVAAVPGSRMLIVGAPKDAPAHPVLRAFDDAGIDRERIVALPRLSLREYWQLHTEVDIALDTSPYGGGTTTCNALWMGVPVVSLAGEFGVARSGASLLTAASLPELVAETPDDYVRIAATLAADASRLQDLRATLRARVASSPIRDEERFVRRLERAYLDAWDACAGRTARAPR